MTSWGGRFGDDVRADARMNLAARTLVVTASLGLASLRSDCLSSKTRAGISGGADQARRRDCSRAIVRRATAGAP